ncbi:hypothetical protein CF386_10920 [Paraphotobacterium marinum]|uniref:ArnT-like N-terminal domain-containing protein n=1 Tax=Paraphotobacterium marinum TaxID=1755811 RepID=A0A220VGM2_9GAMM|nr:glycosyltransferase family 39 protein [Paraphotobacterium marinum]ASK79558.1 hypothetical protein CF386_10920 [Paraphotobacterium marinum]
MFNFLSSDKNKTWLDLLFLSLIFFIAILTYGIPALFSPDETRYAEIAREMIKTHEFIVPHLDGVIYFEKPPLIYWLTAVYLKLFGLNEWAARLVNPILSLSYIIFQYLLIKRIFNSRIIALLSSLLCLTSLLYLVMSRYLNLDIGVAIFINCSLLTFLASIYSQKKSKIWLTLSFIFSFLAVMTKGLIGLVFPMMVIGLWVIFTGRFFLLKNYRLYLGAILVLLVSSIWIFAVNSRYPDFFHYYVIVQQFLRFTTNEQHRSMNIIVYFVCVFAIFIPWLGFLPILVKNYFKNWFNTNLEEKFLIIWFLSIVAFFAFSHSVLIGYFLPLIAPVSILIAKKLKIDFQNNTISSANKIPLILAISFLILFAIAGVIVPLIPKFEYYQSTLISVFFSMSLILLPIIIFSILYLKRKKIRKLLCLIIFGMCIIVNCSWIGAEYLSSKTVKPLINIAQSIMKSNESTIIAGYHDYFYGASFYLHRKLWIIDNPGELEITGKMRNSGAKYTLKTETQLWDAWHSPQKVLMFMRKKDYDSLLNQNKHKLILVKATSKMVLVTNK